MGMLPDACAAVFIVSFDLRKTGTQSKIIREIAKRRKHT